MRRTIGLYLASALLAACAHIGPKTIQVDRFKYSESIADSWKEQTLLNIVKLRYMDLPIFLDVSSIVAGYSLQTDVSISGVKRSDSSILGNSASLGGQAIYTDRPTITYVPLTGEKFLRGMIKPIDPRNIFFLMQSGYPADFILGLTVESLNGVRNRSTAVMRAEDPDFFRALRLLSDVQAADAFGMDVEEDKGSTMVVFFRRDGVSADIAEKAAETRRLLKLSPDQQKFRLHYSPVRGADDELSVTSRSMVQIMTAFATYIDAPAEHVQNHSATPALGNDSADGLQPLVRIHSGKDRPAASFVAVKYRDYWFWIDESDLQTKRALTAVMFLFTLVNTGGNDNLPVITIPAQ